MKRLTEEDVFLHHGHFIQETSSVYRKGMEWDDCLMAGNEGFLYAIRCYQKGLSDFLSYAKRCMYQHVKKEKRNIIGCGAWIAGFRLIGLLQVVRMQNLLALSIFNTRMILQML